MVSSNYVWIEMLSSNMLRRSSSRLPCLLVSIPTLERRIRLVIFIHVSRSNLRGSVKSLNKLPTSKSAVRSIVSVLALAFFFGAVVPRSGNGSAGMKVKRETYCNPSFQSPMIVPIHIIKLLLYYYSLS